MEDPFLIFLFLPRVFWFHPVFLGCGFSRPHYSSLGAPLFRLCLPYVVRFFFLRSVFSVHQPCLYFLMKRIRCPLSIASLCQSFPKPSYVRNAHPLLSLPLLFLPTPSPPISFQFPEQFPLTTCSTLAQALKKGILSTPSCSRGYSPSAPITSHLTV